MYRLKLDFQFITGQFTWDAPGQGNGATILSKINLNIFGFLIFLGLYHKRFKHYYLHLIAGLTGSL